MVRVLGKTLFGLLVGLVAAGSGTAQNETFQESVKLYRLGRLDEAKQKLEEVLAQEPTHEQAFELWRSTDHAVWQALLLEQGEIGKIAKHLLDMATLGRKERSRDADAIAELIEKATSGDYQQRSTAALTLSAEHGEFAVPGLVQKLGDADDDKGQIHAMVALERIGRAATLPLVEALKSDNELIRRNVAAVLAHLRDDRAAAALAHLAMTDPSDGVRDTAARALAGLGLGAGANPVSLHLRDARNYLSDSGVRGGDRSEVVWSLQDGQLVAADAPAAVYHFELAKKSAFDALVLAPDSQEAKALLARAYLGEAAAIGESAGDEAIAAMAAQVPALRMMAAATGLQTVRRAATDSISSGMIPTAVECIALLGDLENQRSVGGTPLVGALSNPDSRIAYAAALAIAKVGGGTAVPAAAQVVDTLAAAVTEEAIMRVKVIDYTPATQRAVQDAAFRRGLQKSVSDSGVDAMNDLYQFPNVDVVVVNEILPDARPEAIIGLIRQDPRMADVKILVLAQDPDAAAERFGDRINGTIQGPLSGESLKAAVEAALADVEADSRRARANRVAVSASNALAGLAQSRVDIGRALGSLAGQLTRADDVAIPAARALGAGGGLPEAGALIGVLQSDDASLDLKVACANAAGDIFSRSAALGEQAFARLLAIVNSGADVALRAAVVQALGKATLATENQLQLLQALQVRPGAGADG